MKKIIIGIIIVLVLLVFFSLRNILYVEVTEEANLYNVSYETNMLIGFNQIRELDQQIEDAKVSLITKTEKLIDDAIELGTKEETLTPILISGVTYEEYIYMYDYVTVLNEEARKNHVKDAIKEMDIKEEEKAPEEEKTIFYKAANVVVGVLLPVIGGLDAINIIGS